MAYIQHKEARRLLRIIFSRFTRGKLLTYREAARLLGRKPPSRHSRAVAQMCDLLDAAACLAGVPLLALVAVRTKPGGINPKAWKRETGPRRDAIIRRSQRHKFRQADLTAISRALNDLGERGNRSAWRYVEGLFGADLLYRRVAGIRPEPGANAIDDLGADLPDRKRSEVWVYDRDPKVRAEVLHRAGGKCEYCGGLGFLQPSGDRYLESHHIIALARDGNDRLTNVIALCPNDHREAHFGKRAKTMEKKMILLLRSK